MRNTTDKPAHSSKERSPEKSLKAFLVGGAVRDRLLGLKVDEEGRQRRDRDWVVVGSTPEQMTELGFRPVGQDFPVFLHPHSHEEYALARTERKTARGYHGFQFNASPEVTLEQDLARRDLTINAMAEDAAGRVIDPFGGQQDLQDRWLRHVSPAFAEDPVRILRVARFMARFAPLGFRVHPDTLALMRQMVENGEVDALVPERVWAELRRALDEPRPSAFIETLRECGALARILPEVDCLWGIPQTARWHPEIDTGVHVMMALDKAAALPNDVTYAVLVHDLGKGITPKEVLPGHRGHESAGVPLVRAVSQRLRVPRDYRQLAETVCRWHLHSHTAFELRPKTIEKLFRAADAYRNPERFEKFLLACQADSQGRKGWSDKPYPQADYLRACLQVASTVKPSADALANKSPTAIGEYVKKSRTQAIATVDKAPFVALDLST